MTPAVDMGLTCFFARLVNVCIVLPALTNVCNRITTWYELTRKVHVDI